MRIENKANEITMFPKIIDALDKLGFIKGKVITIDAMGCQRSLALQLVQLGAFYAFCLKDNQKKTCREVDSLIRLATTLYPNDIFVDTHQTPEARVKTVLESKKLSMVKVAPGLVTEWLTTKNRWAEIGGVGLIETFHRDNTDEEPRLVETRHFVTSLDVSAGEMMEVMRSHWSVETMHKILDDKSSFDEDRCRIRKAHGPENVSLMRKLAIGIMGPYCRLHGVTYGEVQTMCAENFTFLEALLSVRADKVGSPDEWRRWKGNQAAARFVPNMLAQAA